MPKAGPARPQASDGAAATGTPIGTAPELAMGMTYTVMAGSIGLAMQNATAAQQRGQSLAEAALAQVLTLIVREGTRCPRPTTARRTASSSMPRRRFKP